MRTSRPNIVLIMADQHRYDCVGANGHPFIRTPGLDLLAREGMRFTHAFTPIPLCIPARNCFMHGQWSGQHLAIANWDTEAPRPAREGLPTFVQGLRDADYFLGYVGKWHIHPEKEALDYGFHEYVPEHWYGRWREAVGYPPLPRRPYDVREDGSKAFLNQWFGSCDEAVPPDATRPAWSASHVIRMIREHSREDRPFFIMWCTTEPHLPYTIPEPFFSEMYPAEQIPPWPGFDDPLEGKPYIQAQQRRTWKLDDWTWEDWRSVVSRYLGVISLLDAQIQRVLEALDETGAAGSTVVVYTADHGDMCGSHGMIDKHYVMYDDVVRVPLFIRWPGAVPAGSTCGAFVSHVIDLAPTLLQIAGAEIPETFAGKSLLPLLHDPAADNGRSDIFAAYHGNQFGLYTQRMVRDRRWKYVWNATAEDELYDLETDPGEIVNRARDPECAEELARLRRRLVAWMEDTRDPILNRWTRPQLLEGLKQ